MKIDIFSPSVMDSQPLSKADVMESLGFGSDTALSNAIEAGFIPQCADHGGPKGQKRWFVGMFRRWNELKAEAAIKESLSTMKNKNRFKVS